MKKTLLSILAIGMIISVTLNSCSKADEVVAAAAIPMPTTADLMVGTWKLTALKGDSGIVSLDLYNTLFSPCDKDDTEKFNADKSLVGDEGATKCDPADPQTEAGTWSLATNNTQYTTTYPSDGLQTFTIVSLTTTQKVVTTTSDWLPGWLLTGTFTKQ